MVIRVLGILCVGVAHQSNRSTQLEIANSDAFVTLVQLLRTSRISLIQVSRFSAFVHLFVGFKRKNIYQQLKFHFKINICATVTILQLLLFARILYR